MRVAFKDPRDAAPTPWKNLRRRRSSKSRAREQDAPAREKRSRAGTNTCFLPNRSARTPKTGVRMIPGRVNTVMRSPTASGATSNSRATVGKTGATEETPRTASRVTPKMMLRLGSRKSGRSGAVPVRGICAIPNGPRGGLSPGGRHWDRKTEHSGGRTRPAEVAPLGRGDQDSAESGSMEPASFPLQVP